MRSVDIETLLSESKTIAIVGLSRNPEKDSHKVAKYLQSRGYTIIPINPSDELILGEKCYRSLKDLPESLQSSINIVDIFRPSSDVMIIVNQIIKNKLKFKNLKAIWMQLGIINEEAASQTRKVGFDVIMNTCIMISYKQIIRNSL